MSLYEVIDSLQDAHKSVTFRLFFELWQTDTNQEKDIGFIGKLHFHKVDRG